MQPKVLLVTHGRQHKKNNPGYKYLANHKHYCFETATYVDIDPASHPTHVLDLTCNHNDVFETQFDFIFCMYTPYWVLKSKLFWYNIQAWLAPGGIVQTVVPGALRIKDFRFAHRVSMLTGLKILEKRPFMTRQCARDQAIVLQKRCNFSCV